MRQKIFFQIKKYGPIATITFLGLFLRLYKLEIIPPSIFIDEYNLALDALRIINKTKHLPWYGIGWYGTPALFIHYLAFIFKILKPSFWTIKIAWVLPATLVIPSSYFLAKNIFNKQVATISTLFLTLSPIHIHLSRWAHGAIIVPTIFVFSVLALFLFHKKNKKTILILSAFILAISIYTYVGARVYLMFFTIMTLWYLFIYHKEKTLRKILNCFLFWLVFFACLFPFLRYGVNHPIEFTGRTKEVMILNLNAGLKGNINLITENILKYLGMFINLQDPNIRHNPLKTAPFTKTTSFMFGVSFLILFLKKKYKKLLFFTILLITGLAGGILSKEAPSTFRTATIIPFVYMLSGYTLYQILDFLNRKLLNQKTRTQYLALVTILMLTFIPIMDRLIQFYNYQNWQRPDIKIAFTNHALTVAKLAKEYFQRGYIIYLSHDYYWYSSTQFEIESTEKNNPYQIHNPNSLPQYQKGNQYFLILDPADEALLSYYEKNLTSFNLHFEKKSDAKPFFTIELKPKLP